MTDVVERLKEPGLEMMRLLLIKKARGLGSSICSADWVGRGWFEKHSAEFAKAVIAALPDLLRLASRPSGGGDVERLAREILNRHTEYMDGLDRGQRVMKTSHALEAVKEALSTPLPAPLGSEPDPKV